jgi:uncharacterized protein
MNAQTQALTLQGGAGAIEALLDRPDPESFPKPRGLAVLAHPHPLFGGSMSNKVVQTMARAAVAAGFEALRFNFRGVGESAGTHDEGGGELADFLAVVEQQAPDAAAPLVIGGFSFGAFVASHALAALQASRPISHVLLVGTAASRFSVAPIDPALHARTQVIHGEADDTVPLSAVLDWARPQALPITVLPGTGHFFHGQLPLLKDLMLRFLKHSSI